MNIILPAHIIVALASIGLSSWLIFQPTRNKLYTTYGLIAATLISGTYLVMHGPAHVLQTCITGLAYAATVSVGTVVAHTKLARATAHK